MSLNSDILQGFLSGESRNSNFSEINVHSCKAKLFRRHGPIVGLFLGDNLGQSTVEKVTVINCQAAVGYDGTIYQGFFIGSAAFQGSAKSINIINNHISISNSEPGTQPPDISFLYGLSAGDFETQAVAILNNTFSIYTAPNFRFNFYAGDPTQENLFNALYINNTINMMNHSTQDILDRENDNHKIRCYNDVIGVNNRLIKNLSEQDYSTPLVATGSNLIKPCFLYSDNQLLEANCTRLCASVDHPFVDKNCQIKPNLPRSANCRIKQCHTSCLAS